MLRVLIFILRGAKIESVYFRPKFSVFSYNRDKIVEYYLRIEHV